MYTKAQSKSLKRIGSACGSVGKAVASNTRGPPFESSHQQNLKMNRFTVEKTIIKEKRDRKWAI